LKSDPKNAGTIRDYLGAVASHNILALGTDQAFALREEKSGEIRAIKRRLTLSTQNGGLVQPVSSGPYVVSAQGYEMWAEASGTCVMCPEQVLVDGEMRRNPHVVRDPRSKRIIEVWARAVAFRYSSQGLPQVSDWTTIYDVPAYRLIDLVAKAKNQPHVFKLLPDGMTPDDKSGTWACFPVDDIMNLWANTQHNEFISWLGTILNREKKVLDFAQTFAKRNCLKHLSGLQKSPGGNSWDIDVLCWRPQDGSILQWSLARYDSIKTTMQGLSSGKTQALPESVQGHTIDIRRGVDRVEEEPAAIDAEVEPEDRAVEAEFSGDAERVQGPDLGAPLSPEDEKLLKQLVATIEMLPEDYAEACSRLGLHEGAAHSPAEAKDLMREISAIADGR
ncbi:MAG: hypothetical protein R6W92_06800, partial [Desulfocurvibacter africanus]